MKRYSQSSPHDLGTALLLCVIALVSTACAEGTADNESADFFAYENPVFAGTVRLEAKMTIGHPEPTVSWPATNAKHVVAAVFSERIGVKDKAITNPDKIVWIWHSGLGKGHEGNILWAHGAPSPSSTAEPIALPVGTYYWAVWALSDDGLPTHSTEEGLHRIKK